jgi:hypothetical protein
MSNPHDHDEDLAEAAEPFVDDSNVYNNNGNDDDDYDGNNDNSNSNKWKKNGFGQGKKKVDFAVTVTTGVLFIISNTSML